METIEDKFTEAYGASPSEMQDRIDSRKSNRRSILRVRFNKPLSTVMDGILYYYQYEVQSRDWEMKVDNNIMDAIMKVAENMVAARPKNWILISGLYGNGKTTLAMALLDSIGFLNDNGHFKVEGKDKQVQKLSILKTKAVDICNDAADKDLLKLYKTADVLFIDDLGAESRAVQNYGSGSYPIREVLTARHDNQLFTIITTNLTPKDLRDFYDGRIVDRFRDDTLQITMKGESYRIQNNRTE